MTALPSIDEPILRLSGGIEVRLLREEDADSISKYGSDHKVWAQLGDRIPNPYTVSDARDYILNSRHTSTWALSGPNVEDSAAVRLPTQYVIVVDGIACGAIGLTFHTGCHRLGATLGYWLGVPYWRKGIMGRVAPAFVEWTWKTFGYLVRINGTAYEFNIGSRRVMEKSGFVLEGIRKNACIKLGVIHNELWLAATRSGVEAFKVA